MQQAKDYYNIARIAMEADNCNELIVWGLTDAMTWRGGSNPLLYDSDLTPKPAYYDLHQGLRETSSTPTRITNHGLYKKKQPRRLYLLRSLFVSIIQLTSLDKEGNQGRRIKLRCPPKVLTGTLHPSLPSIFSG